MSWVRDTGTNSNRDTRTKNEKSRVEVKFAVYN
jgi:hypothetical protein